MKAVGVIPARWASSRFEGKVLADLCGKPLVQWVWEQTKKAKLLDKVIIACDDKRIFDACELFGAKAVMTSDDHVSGSDRIAEAVEDLNYDIVVNIQGDEPLIKPQVIDDLVQALIDDKECPMATVIKNITDPKDIDNPNVVKVVTDVNNYALYFSRAPIPYNRDKTHLGCEAYNKHFGIYAYRKDFLLAFRQWPKSFLEGTEKLEQLRVLEAGQKIRVVVTKYDSVGVDTIQDLKKVEALMKELMN